MQPRIDRSATTIDASAGGAVEPSASPNHTPLPSGRAGRLVRWLLVRADRPGGVLLLVLFAFLEATLFPAPTEVMLLALAIARPRRAWWLGSVATIASVAGGLVGYHLGLVLFDDVARPLLASRGLLQQFDVLGRLYGENALLALVSSGYTPIPYLLYTMTAGAFELPITTFVAGSLIGRALKYAPLAVVAYVLGPAAQRFLERYAGWIATAVLAITLALFFLGRR